jgi:hypothetical protein
MWLLDKLYKPLICNEFLCGKTLFYPLDAMFAYENRAFWGGRAPAARLVLPLPAVRQI